MPHCQNCAHQWSWTDTLKLSFKYFKGVKCPNCGKEQYVSIKSKQRPMLISFIGVFILVFSRPLFDLNLLTYTLLAILLLLIVLIATLYSIKLSNEQEPLW